MDQVNLRTQYTTGKSTAVKLTFWNPSGVEIDGWASATVQGRQARSHGAVARIGEAGAGCGGGDRSAKKSAMYIAYQKAIIDQANLLVLFQPVYQFAYARRKASLTAAGWGVGILRTSS